MSRIWEIFANCLFCKRKDRPSERTIYVENQPPLGQDVIIPEKYPNNTVVSSRYTLWNFLPKNLFEQFRRIANFYFLCVGIVQLAIDTPVSPATSITPLIFVVAVTAIKQGYEDRLRHKADREVNNREVDVIRNGNLTCIKSMDIKVGDVVKVSTNQSFPCDLVMLSSHDPDGTCYITTANLDGETNLKTHFCISDTRKFQQVDDFTKLHAYIECQQPIPDLYKFIGRITLQNENSPHEPVVRSLGPENVLLRGARLKNTPYIFGCAIYTGPDTKLSLNSKAKQTKFSRIERKMNTFLLIFLVILFIEASVSTGLKYWYVFQPQIGQPWYVPNIEIDAQVTIKRIIEDFLSFIVLYNYVIPISLYVTVELQKFVGSMYFDWDIEMYDEGGNQPAKANTSDINEELGQVEYLFTDKTGTLTENNMQFRQCSVNGVRYEEVGGMLCEINEGQSQPVGRFSEELEDLFVVLSLCHTLRVDYPEAARLGVTDMFSSDGFDYDYQASSPDEKAFVEASRRYGIVYHGKHDDRLHITVKGEMRRYKLLHVLEFDPTRKRMSVIIQNEQALDKYAGLSGKPTAASENHKLNEIRLLCKGAESAILDRVVSGDKEMTLLHVNEYAVLGLRTLVIAERKLSPKDFSFFNEQLKEARNSLQDREQKLNQVFESLETNLTLLGATAVEDKLQDDVPETISSLRIAGIKVWVLTGDKEETAVNISFSAGHFQSGMEVLRLTKIENSIQCADEIRTFMNRVEHGNTAHVPLALVVDGSSLTFALSEHAAIFRDLCRKCLAVLCCRMTPLQKADVVKLIKMSKDRPVTAAIGDGANDVSMIQEADVGLGMMGKEGRQAVRNSDYAFARFKFLRRALLMHGHYYYIRLSNLVLYFFYKNVAFITSQLFFQFFVSFSQQSVYDGFYLMFYNITMTSLPIFIYGLFEQHVDKEDLLKKPYLYRRISKNNNLSILKFVMWCCIGLWQNTVFFFGVFFLHGEEVSLFASGQMSGIFLFGSVLIITCIITVNIKLGLLIRYWSWPVFFAFGFALLGNLLLTGVYNAFIWPSWMVGHSEGYYVFNKMWTSASVWLGMIVLIVLALIPDLVLKVYRDSRLEQDLKDSYRLLQNVGSKPEDKPHSDSQIPLRSLSSWETNRFVPWNHRSSLDAIEDTPVILKKYEPKETTYL
ncbi:hypothetical protein CHS0354_021404 [Potamilus streckersoni]|uniref:Phospholipid-transporting ATPase n=1 Tax=Potamilus streckersoni TaxID=2493646 RepID=A0AAE0VMG3_9BIVA|nr:hypothetical protein CHS0354_021404 [Potamilus streckersoni]